jgi:hypothetical protein
LEEHAVFIFMVEVRRDKILVAVDGLSQEAQGLTSQSHVRGWKMDPSLDQLEKGIGKILLKATRDELYIESKCVSCP